MKPPTRRFAPALLLLAAACASDPARVDLWRDGKPAARVIPPSGDARAAKLVRATLDRHLRNFYGVELPAADRADGPGPYVVAGTPENNPVLAGLVHDGLALTTRDLGEEGFQLLTHRAGGTRYIVVYGRTPRALKHGCQELLFYRTPASAAGGAVEWPLDVAMRPAIPYRGIYILPCWSAHDSLDSWRRVLLFDSEITLNRNWFWLDGFPVAGHTGEYAGTDLASDANVQSLIDLTNDEDMKFLIGGGWMNWHHAKAVGTDLEKGKAHHLAYLKAFRGFHGFYFEPTGEGSETQRWKEEGGALADLMRTILRERPDFEIALAIGKFNNPDYLRMMAGIDPARVVWWWCWGDAWQDKALAYTRNIARWHLSQSMSEYHGSMQPPGSRDRELAGVATSYDPGQGFGNSWNGWGALGTDHPRNFHPHTIPYFGRQYHFRERCWDPDMTDDAFVARLQRRLFDDGAPADAGRLYWRLSQITLATVRKVKPAAADLAPIRALAEALRARPLTPRATDTLRRMDEALGRLEAMAAK